LPGGRSPSIAPFYRAEQDYQAFGKYSDYLKVVIYNNCGGRAWLVTSGT
jgi:hypothetical protein